MGLLCGTDWTPLYNNQYFYSRFDHSVGVALILWNFTHDRKQTIAGLLHDVSTPAFSHVSDFRKGDALTQESTEEDNRRLIHENDELCRLLADDDLTPFDVDDYHRFPIADNEIPHLSADRLEYMFPSGIILNQSFDLESTERLYNDISLCYNELNELEVGFETESSAVEYCRRFCNAGLVLQHNENKISLQLLAEVLSLAFKTEILCEENLFDMSEFQIIELFDSICERKKSEEKYKNFIQYYRTFRTMKKIERSDKPLPGCFNLSLDVKKRYIDPLVIESAEKMNEIPKGIRISKVSPEAQKIVENFLSFQDALYGCVKLVDN